MARIKLTITPYILCPQAKVLVFSLMFTYLIYPKINKTINVNHHIWLDKMRNAMIFR